VCRGICAPAGDGLGERREAAAIRRDGAWAPGRVRRWSRNICTMSSPKPRRMSPAGRRASGGTLGRQCVMARGERRSVSWPG
jgi:hypothetical protein